LSYKTYRLSHIGNEVVENRPRPQKFFTSEVREMKTSSSRVTSKGQIVIPKRLRERYGIRPTTRVRWIEKQDGILMVPETEDPIMAARGMLRGAGILKAYLEEKELEKRRENRKGPKKKRACPG
jgi:AbrB family looped-hinge helix DNA binding protein